ncbi:hypothetical protein GCK72_008754 [Caenorhabditis remanei]|uniref:Serpentine receptor class gamma n=1 Tax=Caenorhabditis remanei TaxID=31234 RepID=A0A6A5H0U9_CAERE|nr:hypothetical protein GCK72_008754 [Caenorhabditis remanei]KAF1760505.1 hypothetical protein GCK72_008754 [Caenorhabditis remanei]
MADTNSANDALRSSANCDSGDSDASQYIKFCIQLAYILPFGYLYSSFLITIIRKKKDRELFGDSFFTLHLVDGIVDPAYYLTPYWSVYVYVQLAKMLSTLVMNINRYTSVSYPIQHKSIWMQHCFKSVLAIFLIPIIFTWPVAIARTSFLPLNGQSVIVYDHYFSWARTTYGRLLISTVTLVFIIFSSIVTSTKLRKMGKHMKHVEFSMTVATLFTSAGFTVLLVVQFFYLNTKLDTLTTWTWTRILIVGGQQVGNDFYMLSGPVVLLILDKNIRKSTFQWKRGKIDSQTNAKVSVQSAQLVTITN